MPAIALEAAHQSGQLLDSAFKNIESFRTLPGLPAYAQDSLQYLIQNQLWAELNNRFYQNLSFGTGGMRGRTIANTPSPSELNPQHPGVGTNLLNDFNVIKATLGLFHYTQHYLKENNRSTETPTLIIAYDVRHFSNHFAHLTLHTWNQLGGQASLFKEPRSTPQLSFTVRHLNAHAGIVITASHNPPHDNGYKVYFEDGAQITSPHADAIVDHVQKIPLADTLSYITYQPNSDCYLPPDVDLAYHHALKDGLLEPHLLQEHAPKIVFSPIHGTGASAFLPTLEALGASAHTTDEQMHQHADFPTVKSPNPENPEALALAIQKAKELSAELVIATDPDADRMGIAYKNRVGDFVLLSGNRIGSLLADYRISQLKRLNLIPQNGSPNVALIKTFVTTELQASIANKHTIKCINTLTGFKWIGKKLHNYEAASKLENYAATPLKERIQALTSHSTYMAFGGEESYGYLSSDLVRDKDANGAALLFCEMLAYLKSQNKTLDDALEDLYTEHGYYDESLLTLTLEGAQGAQNIRKILQSYRKNPPQEIASFKVSKITDFAQETIEDADADIIPKQDFFILELENTYRYAIRASGTEPKIKFYLFAHEPLSSKEYLPTAQHKALTTLNAIKESLEADAHARYK